MSIKVIVDAGKGLYQTRGDGGLFVSSGSTVDLGSNVLYTPENPADWSSVPGNLIQAVDYLAAGSGSGGGGGGGGSPGGSNGDIQYRVDASTFGGVDKLSFIGGNLVGTGSFNGVFSGSLTKLEDGSNYLLAGSNVTLTTGSNGAVTIAASDGSSVPYAQEVYVALGANASIANGSQSRPYASISAAMTAITDASPTKRYAVMVTGGAYTEASALNIKPNVFVIGSGVQAVRITAPSFGMDASFSGGGGVDNRSGYENVILIGTCNFNWTTVTSSAGKLYFTQVAFNSAVTLTGYNNSIAQSQFTSCQFFGTLAISGINVGVFFNNYVSANIVLTQHASLATILSTAGGWCGGTLTATTTVTDFNRRISVFARSFWINGPVTIDGASSYLDYTADSIPSGGITTLNSGNTVLLNPSTSGADTSLSNLVFPTAVNQPIIPASTSATDLGTWNKQWLFTFSYVYLSTGTEMYLGTAGTGSGVPDSAGRTVYIQPDQYGLETNVNGGTLDLRTATPSGTGNSGDIVLITGTPGGSGTRGLVVIDSPLRYTTGSVGASPTATQLRTNPIYNVADAAITLPTMTSTDDGLTIKLLNTTSGNSTVTPPVGGVAKTMTTKGGQSWVWSNTSTTWFCISNV